MIVVQWSVGGGFSLSVDANDASVLDVVNAVDPFKRILTCLWKRFAYMKKLCPLHFKLAEEMESVEKVLAKTFVCDLMNDLSRPDPLIDSICW